MIWAVLAIAVIINLAGWTLHTSLAPIFAPGRSGHRLGGVGVDAVRFRLRRARGSMSWAMVPSIRNAGRLLIVAVFMWHATILLFSLSHWFYLSIAILVSVGASFASTQALILTLLLRATQAEYRGRVMSLRSFAILAYSFGTLGAGALAGFWGRAGRRAGRRYHRHHPARDPSGPGPQAPPSLNKIPSPIKGEG